MYRANRIHKSEAARQRRRRRKNILLETTVRLYNRLRKKRKSKR